MEKKKKHHKKLIIALSSIGGFIAVCFVAFFIYAGIYNHATDDALNYLKDSETVKVEDTDSYVTFSPKKDDKKIGFIFYPGGKVEYKAYAPILNNLSSEIGITSVLVKMPFNLAVFDMNGADKKQDLYPEIKDWYIGGHSLGGAMSCSYLSKHLSDYRGAILFAAYSTEDLTDNSDLKVLSLLASNDHVLKKNKYNSNKKNLPNLIEKTIEGGIHSYFGDYGIQNGDGTPTITVAEQRKEIVSHISSFVL